jgi:hypothetical protein
MRTHHQRPNWTSEDVFLVKSFINSQQSRLCILNILLLHHLHLRSLSVSDADLNVMSLIRGMTASGIKNPLCRCFQSRPLTWLSNTKSNEAHHHHPTAGCMFDDDNASPQRIPVRGSRMIHAGCQSRFQRSPSAACRNCSLPHHRCPHWPCLHSI